MNPRTLRVTDADAVPDLATTFERRSISECILLAEAHEAESGEQPVLDLDFAADVEEIARNRKPWNPPPWE